MHSYSLAPYHFDSWKPRAVQSTTAAKLRLKASHGRPPGPRADELLLHGGLTEGPAQTVRALRVPLRKGKHRRAAVAFFGKSLRFGS